MQHDEPAAAPAAPIMLVALIVAACLLAWILTRLVRMSWSLLRFSVKFLLIVSPLLLLLLLMPEQSARWLNEIWRSVAEVCASLSHRGGT